MLNSFRRFTKSRFGLIIVFAVLALIAAAFALGDITGLNSQGSSGNGVVAKVGKVKITEREVRERIERFIRDSQAQGQNVTMEEFLARDGLNLAINELIDITAYSQFAAGADMQVSKKLLDTDMANASAFMGIDGKFDQKALDAWLSEKRMSMATLYSEVSRDRYRRWLANNFTMSGQVPTGVVLPYASLALERRTGIVGLVQTAAMDAGAEPDDKTLTAFYTAHRGPYMVPERRIVRYAITRPDELRAAVTVSDADIAEAYKKDPKRFAASEKRTVSQVVIANQAVATRIAAEIKGGKSAADSAKAAGLEAATFTSVEKSALARQTAQPIADAAFAAAQGGVVGPVRSQLGWHVLKVDKVELIAAKSLEQAKTELSTELFQRKSVQALVDRRQAIEDGIGEGKTFDELVRDAKLSAQRTPLLANNGLDPLAPAEKADPVIAQIAKAGFGIEQAGDEPQIVPIAPDGSFAIASLERVVAAAPRPFAEVREQVKGEYLIDYRLKQARKLASDITNSVNKGTPLPEAFTKAGVTKGAPPKPFDLKRSEVSDKENFIRLAFTMAAKKARLIEAPNRAGFYVVFLDKIEEKSAAGDPILIEGERSALDRTLGLETEAQFVRAIRRSVKATRDEAVIKRLRDELARQGAGN